MDIDELLNKPYWLIDFLPYRVPANSAGQFFAIEDFYMKSPQSEKLHMQFLEVQSICGDAHGNPPAMPVFFKIWSASSSQETRFKKEYTDIPFMQTLFDTHSMI